MQQQQNKNLDICELFDILCQKNSTLIRDINEKTYPGPLHTKAMSCEHEIVRAQKKVSKSRPNTPVDHV
jgi:hypothetical protein